MAVDDHTIKATLGEPFAPYLVSWQKTSIVPKHLLADIPDINTAPFNTQPVGTGPFKFKKRVAGDHIEFERNPNYHGDGPHLSTLVQKYVPDQQTLYAQFQTGQVEIYDLQGIPPLLPRAKQLPNKIDAERCRRPSSSSSISTAASRSSATSGCARPSTWRWTRKA